MECSTFRKRQWGKVKRGTKKNVSPQRGSNPCPPDTSRAPQQPNHGETHGPPGHPLGSHVTRVLHTVVLKASRVATKYGKMVKLIIYLKKKINTSNATCRLSDAMVVRKWREPISLH